MTEPHVAGTGRAVRTRRREGGRMARRVLVVDDEAAIRRVLRAYLEAEAASF